MCLLLQKFRSFLRFRGLEFLNKETYCASRTPFFHNFLKENQKYYSEADSARSKYLFSDLWIVPQSFEILKLFPQDFLQFVNPSIGFEEFFNNIFVRKAMNCLLIWFHNFLGKKFRWWLTQPKISQTLCFSKSFPFEFGRKK